MKVTIGRCCGTVVVVQRSPFPSSTMNLRSALESVGVAYLLNRACSCFSGSCWHGCWPGVSGVKFSMLIAVGRNWPAPPASRLLYHSILHFFF